MAIVCGGGPFQWFSLKEIANNQAADKVKLVFTPKLIRQGRMMDDLRNWYGKPLNVNSWYRTKEFNTKVKGSKNSCHLDGTATDIALPRLTEIQRKEFIAAWRMLCVQRGVIGGVSIYAWGLHFDSNDDPKRFASGDKFRVTDYRR